MDKQNIFKNIQGFFAIGYIYLIVLGIFNQTLLYTQLDVKILKYSSVLDILMTPISILTSSFLHLIIFSIIVFAVLFAPSYLAKRKNKSWIKKATKIEKDLTDEEAQKVLFGFFVALLAYALFGFFIGTGIGSGLKINKKLKKAEIEFNDKLEFVDNNSMQVNILEITSEYIFYLKPGNDKVIIAPINGNIKNIIDN